PSIDALLAGPGVARLLAEHPRGLVVKAARETVDAARINGGAAPAEGWDAALQAAVERLAVPSLAPVINATGVVLHTNLGRAPLVEVGTTNRTEPHDYERALTADSRLLLKVHRSNFQVTGFTADVAVVELAELAYQRKLICLYDLGSGLLMNLSQWGLTGEPTVPEAVASGAGLIAFSGDKLLGGPQAGILVGTEQAIAACRADPIARTVRADKLTLAALEAT